MVKLVPVEDHVLVEPVTEESKTPSGIILPDSDKEKPSRGKVVAVGEGKILENGERAPMDVKEWDIVYFTKYSPDELTLMEDGEEKAFLVVRHSSILAIERS